MSLVPLRTPLIDSLSISWKLSEVKLIDERLTSATRIYYETIEAVEDDLNPPKPMKLSFNGINLRFWLTEIPIYSRELEKKIQTTFVNFTLSSKLLKGRYFEGISSKTILYLYNTLMDLEVIRMGYDQFKKGYIKDIDICINDRMKLKHFDQLVHDLNTSVKPTKKHLVKSFHKPHNIGINFNNRITAKSLSPNYKIYFKQEELLHKSYDFYKHYLKKPLQESGDTINDLVRAEFTIKNYTHKEYLVNKGHIKTMPKTLEDLLNIDLFSLKSIIHLEGLPNYLKHFSHRLKTKLSPLDTIIIQFMKELVLLGHSKDSIIKMVSHIKGKDDKNTQVQQSRTRKKLTELFEILEESQQFHEMLNTNKTIRTFLKETLGLPENYLLTKTHQK